MPITHTCPHCSKTSEVDAVPQATFDERRKAIEAQRDNATALAKDAEKRAQELAAQSKDWKAAAEELSAIKAKTEEDGALTAAGLRADVDPRHRAYLRALYDSAPAPETGDKPTFADFLRAAAASATPDPFVAALRANPAALAAPPAPGTPAAPAPGTPAAPPAPPRPPVLPPRGEAAPAPASTGLEGVMRAAAAAAAAGRPWTREEMAAATKPHLPPKA